MVKSLTYTALRKYGLKQLRKRELMLKKVERKALKICKKTKCDASFLLKTADELGKTRGIIIEKEVKILEVKRSNG